MRIKPLVVPVIAENARLDLALLKVGAKFKRFATFRDGEIRKGETVVVSGAAGAPGGALGDSERGRGGWMSHGAMDEPWRHG